MEADQAGEAEEEGGGREDQARVENEEDDDDEGEEDGDEDDGAALRRMRMRDHPESELNLRAATTLLQWFCGPVCWARIRMFHTMTHYPLHLLARVFSVRTVFFPVFFPFFLRACMLCVNIYIYICVCVCITFGVWVVRSGSGGALSCMEIAACVVKEGVF